MQDTPPNASPPPAAKAQPSKTRAFFLSQSAEQTASFATGSATKSYLPVSLSLILLATAITVGASIIGWTSIFQESEKIEISLESVSAQPTGNLEMTGARYSGTTENGVTFSINAERAIETGDQKGRITLFSPDGFVTSQQDGKTSLSSVQAIYHSAERRLEMTGQVTIVQSQRALTLTSEEMTALIGKGELLSQKPVTLKGENVLLTAEGMHATENGEVILFTGKSRMKLKQN